MIIIKVSSPAVSRGGGAPLWQSMLCMPCSSVLWTGKYPVWQMKSAANKIQHDKSIFMSMMWTPTKMVKENWEQQDIKGWIQDFDWGPIRNCIHMYVAMRMYTMVDILLPPANKVWGKIIFSQASVCAQREKGVSLTETPLDRDPPLGRDTSLDRDPLDRDPPGQKDPLNRDPLDRDP